MTTQSAALGSAPPAADSAFVFTRDAATALHAAAATPAAPAPPATLLQLLQALVGSDALAAGAPAGVQAPLLAGAAAAAAASPAGSSDNSASDAPAERLAAPRASAPRAKRRLTDAQESLLYASFASGPRLTRERKAALAAATRLAPRQGQVWFQNRRARAKGRDAAARCAALEAAVAALRAENGVIRDAARALAAAEEAHPAAGAEAVVAAKRAGAVLLAGAAAAPAAA